MILSPALFKCVKFARISVPYLRTSDHCLLSYFLEVPNVVTNADWNQTHHLVAENGTSNMALVWKLCKKFT